MALIINTNSASINAQRQLLNSGMSLDQATQRLSSGQRINSAKDDAAGLAISNKMTSQIRGLDQAVRNANDGVSLIQTAEGALAETTNILQRMRELAVQSSNGIYSNADRKTLDAESKQLTSELDRIAKSTSFNGQNLLDGKLGNIKLQVGADAGQQISFKIAATSAKSLGMGSTSVDLMGGETTLASLTGAKKLVEGSVLINGQSIIKGTDSYDGASATDPLSELVDHINNNVNGITASTYAEAAATTAGTGVLTATQKVVVTLTNNDGTTTAIDTGGESTNLKDLVDKMNANSGGKYNATINDDGNVIISAEGVKSIAVTDASSALGSGITTAGTARIVLKADNGDPVTVTRGSNGTLEQMGFLGFRENDVAGTIEGHKVNSTALAVGDLKINGVGIGASATGGLSDKLKAINAVSDQTGVTAKAFTSTSLDFSSVALSTLVGGVIGVNGVDVTIPAGGATTKVSDIATAFNAQTDKTGITATVSGSRLILEGNVAQIQFGPDSTGTATAVTTALTDGTNTVLLAEAGLEGSAAAITDTSVAAGGIKLTSTNGNPISVDVKNAAATAKTGLIDSNSAAGGSFGTAIASISIDTQSNAQKAIKVIDNALTTINDTRASLGAVNNRLDFTVSNLSSIAEKTTSARSRIVDADFASETASLSRATVLQQAATAMLAQANQRPQNVLSLLR